MLLICSGCVYHFPSIVVLKRFRVCTGVSFWKLTKCSILCLYLTSCLTWSALCSLTWLWHGALKSSKVIESWIWRIVTPLLPSYCKVCQTKEINVGIRSKSYNSGPLQYVTEHCAAWNYTVCRLPLEQHKTESTIHLLPENKKAAID